MASNGSERPRIERPRIGITTYRETASWGVWHRPAALLPVSYVDAVRRAGGIPLLLPNPASGSADVPAAEGEATAALSVVDGLLVAGGADVDPARYGQEPHETVRETRPDRDEWETRLLHAALERDVPVLAVCRGAQVLNVALGGSLHQHLPDVGGDAGHQPAPATYGRISVQLTRGSTVAAILGEHVEVPCYHHQALAEIGGGLEITGRARDGTVEALELPTRRFVLGVQWHPEEDAADGRLFAALTEACARIPRPRSGGDR